MENSPRTQEDLNPSLLPSPNSHSTNSSSSSSNSNGVIPVPTPITRSEPNPYPTTFVQADTFSFKQVVQMLTGSSETAKQALSRRPTSDSSPLSTKNPIPPVKTTPKKQQGFKLYERRNSLKNLKISPLMAGSFNCTSPSGFPPRTPEVLSPSLLNVKSLVLSPVTPLMTDPFNRCPHQNRSWPQSVGLDPAAEEKAISEKRFFLHSSPATTPRDSEPRLLPLFPVTSPGSSSFSS